MKRTIVRALLVVVFLGLPGLSGARASSSDVVIADDPLGGDCASVGAWDASARACTLRRDVNGGISFADDGITLDGGGFAASRVVISERADITVTNLTVSGGGIVLAMAERAIISGNTILDAGVGIGISYGAENVISRNTISNNGYGVYVEFSAGNRLEGNTIAGNDRGIDGYYAREGVMSGNTITDNGIGFSGQWVYDTTVRDNHISRNGDGVRWAYGGRSRIVHNVVADNEIGIGLAFGQEHIVRRNTISNNHVIGIDLHWTDDTTQVYNNNFMDNGGSQARREPDPRTADRRTVFHLPAPVGGNYWSNWATPDRDRDGFVDQPYAFPGGQDGLPWTTPNGWLAGDAGAILEAKRGLCANGGISGAGICKALEGPLGAARKALLRGEAGAAASHLKAFVGQLDAQLGKGVGQEAYDTLHPAALALIEELGAWH